MSRIQTRIPGSDVAGLRQPTVAGVLGRSGAVGYSSAVGQSGAMGQCQIQIVSVTPSGESRYEGRGRSPAQLTQVVAGSLIECQYCLSGFEAARADGGRGESGRGESGRGDPIRAIEHSILWHTSGKGTRDFVVHFFERRKFAKSGSSADGVANLERQACLQPYLFRSVCPTSPLTYHGKLLAIDWLVRVRVFLASGQDFSFDQEFVVVAPTNSGKAVQ